MDQLVYDLIYSLPVDLAISLFLVFYTSLLVMQARRSTVVQPVSLPAWFNFMYPDWLDRLTFRQILMSFALGLGLAIISWIVLAVVFLAMIARTFGS